MRKSFILSFVLIVSFMLQSRAQGCSDAGFCTMQHLNVDAKQAQDSIGPKNDIGLGLAVGMGDDHNLISNPYLTYNHDFSNRFSLSSKVTGSIISGKKGSAEGLGDVYLSASYKTQTNRKLQVTFLGALKLPLNKSDLHYNGQVLPLSYQSSLGSLDAILGVNVSSVHFDFNAGAQIPLKQWSQNTFFAKGVDTIDFASTNHFRRKSDLLFRVTYHFFNKQKNWKFSGGVLNIYHLGNDTYVNQLGDRMEIPHSYGLTLNAVLAAHHYFKNKNYATLSFGTPFIVRQIRPDGLTRSFVLSFEYHIQF